MNVSFGYCEDVLKTLPIGYYLGHPVAVRLGANGNSTYIELGCERITIGFKNIVDACKTAPDGYDRETIIRSLFYHEISHAILTPGQLMKCMSNKGARLNIVNAFKETICKSNRANAKQLPNPRYISTDSLQYIMKNLHDIVNIFEDERIETRLRSYYMNVDFKRLVVLLNGDPKKFCDRDPMGRFFALVRYRHGDPSLVQQVQQLIKSFQLMDNTSTDNTCSDYIKEIIWLMYQVMCTMPMQNAQDEKSMQNAQDTESDSNKNPTGQSAQDEKSMQSAQDNCAVQAAQNDQDELSDDEIDQIVKAAESSTESFDNDTDSDKIKVLFKNQTTNPEATAIAAKVNKVLMSALNKQKNLSSGSHGYAGRLDPRAVVNRDYKWFAKKNQGSAAKRFNKIRFNLFVDSSGSFIRSQNYVNALICALKKIESTNPDFSVRVVHCGDGTKIAPPDDPYVLCDNFSYLDADTKAKYDSLQVPSTSNVNIVVFDGSMIGRNNATDKAYAAFNHPNCIIVSDDDNQNFINNNAPQAKAVIVSHDYASTFTDIVLRQVENLLA